MPDDEGMFSPPWSSRDSESRTKKQGRKDTPLLEKVADFSFLILFVASLLAITAVTWPFVPWLLRWVWYG
jgi:hypothetical protein